MAQNIDGNRAPGGNAGSASLVFSVPFPLSGPGGKSAGTRRKVEALRALTGVLEVFAPESGGGIAGKVYRVLRAEAQALRYLIRHRRTIDVYISRSIAGFLAVPVARALGIRTVRDLHADSIEEAHILARSRSRYLLLSITARISHWLDQAADIRVFNHPALARWYEQNGWGGARDFVCYNGGKVPTRMLEPEAKKQTRSRIGAGKFRYLLCFCGSVAPWHGVERLAALQQAFNRNRDPVSIVCVGGPVPDTVDPDRLLRNISPADERECEAVAQSADLCLLPVQNIRRSPGSPLKLFDYLLMGATIVTQRDTEGYSDIVDQYGAGFSIDFGDSESARQAIVEYLHGQKPAAERRSNLDEITWPARMQTWLTHILR